MDDNHIQEESLQVNTKKHMWKIISILVSILLVICIIGAYFVIDNNNKVLNSWKTLYEKEKNTNMERKQNQDIKYQEYESKINKLTNDFENLKQSFSNIFNELIEEQKISSRLLCNEGFYDFSNVNFEYGGNTAMNRDLKIFVENNILKSNEKITGTTWDPIWNNVDVAMHKISITGNIRLFFITSFLDNEFGFKNSVYWIDGGCFLDFPDE